MVQLQETELWELQILALRVYARYVGVRAPTTKKKADIIREILAIQRGALPPVYARRGRPPTNTLLCPASSEPPPSDSPPRAAFELRAVSVSDIDGRRITAKNLAAAKSRMRRLFVALLSSDRLPDLEIMLALLDILYLHIERHKPQP